MAEKGRIALKIPVVTGKPLTAEMIKDMIDSAFNLISDAMPTSGDTPYIGTNGNWWIGTNDLGVRSEAIDGETPVIGNNGNWWVGGVDTGEKAVGQDGYTPQKNVDYFDGVTPVKGVDYFDGVTPVKGVDYFDGITPHIGVNGNWWFNGVDSGERAIPPPIVLTPQVILFSSNVDHNMELGRDAIIILGGNVEVWTILNLVDGDYGMVNFTQDSVGGHQVLDILHSDSGVETVYRDGKKPTLPNINSFPGGINVFSFKRFGSSLLIDVIKKYGSDPVELNLLDWGLSSNDIDDRLIYYASIGISDSTIDIRGNEARTSASDNAVSTLIGNDCIILEDSFPMGETNLLDKNFSSNDIDQRLIYLASIMTSNVTIDIRGNSGRTPASDAAVVTLTNNDCIILEDN